MSLEINWDLLSSDEDLNNRIKDFIDEQFQKIELPEFIKDIKVTNFFIGKIPPSVIIRHIGDPFHEFYESDDEDDDDCEQYNNGSRQPVPGSAHGGPSTDDDAAKRGSLPSLSLGQKSNGTSSKDLQIIAEIDYRGDLFIEISTNLLLNYPSISFIELPIKLKVTDLVIHSLAILSYAKKLVNFSFLCDISDDNLDSFVNSRTQSTSNINHIPSPTMPQTPITPIYPGQTIRHNSNPVLPTFSSSNKTSRYINKDRIDIIKDLRIDSEIGGGTYGNQSSGSVLKNVGKVEKFLVEKIRSILRDELAWPGWISFDFSGSDDENDEDEEILVEKVSTQENGDIKPASDNNGA